MKRDRLVDEKILSLRQIDPVGSAALAFRYRSTCPVCRGVGNWSEENAVTSERSFGCTQCGWSYMVSETVWRGDPTRVLREVVEEARKMKEAYDALSSRSRSRYRPDVDPGDRSGQQKPEDA